MDKLIYYLYHIPGKKIGVTRNLNNRVTKQQGYFPDEYEVLDHSDDINYISKREIELQQSYGYKIDRVEYKNLNKNMKINATEMTSTFPYPLNKLKGNLMDKLGESWETMYGKFKINNETVRWIIDNAKTSMYDTKRSYIYNKAFFEKFINETKSKILAAKFINEKIKKSVEDGFVYHKQTKDTHPRDDRFQLIRNWAKSRGLYAKGDTKTQYCKLMEEAGELGRAILKDDQPEFVDAIGDMVVVLTNLAHLGNTSIEACIDAAYAEIKTRKGKMENGTFVKS